MRFEQEVRAIQTKPWNIQAVCTHILARDSIPSRARRRLFQLPGPQFFLSSSFPAQNQSEPKSLSIHLHVISVFRLHKAVPPLHRAWCLGTRPKTILVCDIMHCGRGTKFRRHMETAEPSEKLVPFYLISWRYIPLVTYSSYSQLEEFWMSNVCSDTVSSELRTKQGRIFSLLSLLAKISTFLLCFSR